MVSQDSSSNTNILHQFIMSAAQGQYGSQQHYDAYAAGLGPSGTNQPLGLLQNIQSFENRISPSTDLAHPHHFSSEAEVNQGRNFMDLLGASSEANYQAQRLSLSLGSHGLVSPSQYRAALNCPVIGSGYANGGEDSRVSCNSYDYSSFAGSGFASSSPPSGSQACSTTYGREPFPVAISSSKYLKAAQSVLEEMVSVDCKTVNLSNEKYLRKLSCHGEKNSRRLGSELTAELSSIELCSGKHELHAQIAKLIALLEEVEMRYEKYYNHLEESIASFEMIAGVGAGKSYTALALQAMSRHFCSLRDAIVSQILSAKRKFSKDLPKISNGLSRLSLLDKENRQNRISLQQLGMLQSPGQAWRPIRGLPETSVTILRSWLFEHFLHPYPSDSEKLMLASQTGLTKNQISNWFINARVRLWKPMIEEMYKEEFADDSNESDALLRECVTDSADE